MKFCLPDVATANLDDITITIEGTARNLIDLLPLCSAPWGNSSIMPAAVGSATWDVYIDIPCVVSAAASGAGAITMIPINDGGNYVTNFAAVTIGQFKGGKDYLITNIATAVVDMIPKSVGNVAPVLAGTTSGVFTSSRFWYHAPKDASPLNATTVDVITFDVDYSAKSATVEQKVNKKINDIRQSEKNIGVNN